MKKLDLKKEKVLNWAIGIFVVIALIRFVSTPSQDGATQTETDISTTIPRGYVIVPIEIENSLSLEGVLGDIGGYVDLYEALENGQGKQVAHHIKLVRAPKDPRQFAVLAKESQAPALVRHEGRFIATMRNPEDRTQRFQPAARTQPKIFYGEANK